MGLDMYLYLKKYDSCGKWDEDYNEKQKRFYPKELKEFADEISNDNFMSKETYYQIGYWRKANAIHKWFVDNCADGDDDCRKVYVPLQKLKDLRDLCYKVLKNKDNAEELLKTTSGFFFGSTDYDEWYFEDIKYTKELLDKVIAFVDKHDYDIIYQASW